MDLDLSDDQVALRDGIAALLAGRFGSERVRAGFDRAMFDELAGAGVFSLRADGFAWADCVVVFEQLGRACVPGPLVGCLLAGGGSGVTGIVEAAAGSPVWVEHLDALDRLLVLAAEGLGEIDPRVLAGRPSPWPLDPLTPVTLVDALPPAAPAVLDGPDALAALDVARAGAALTAALQLGLADRCTELAVDYAKQRVQFDRPIGGFQAVKHLCADMLVRTEVARAAVYAAGAHLDEGAAVGDLDRSIAVAKVLAGEAAVANGKTATQVFGGMGFTWEVDVHLYLKRAWVLDTHFGTADARCDAVADALART